MIKHIKLLIIVLFFAVYASFAECRNIADAGGFSEVVDQVYDGVVSINGSRKVKTGVGRGDVFFKDFEDLLERFFNLDPQRGREVYEKSIKASGSGFVFDKAGIIVTNYHIIEGASEIEVVFNDGLIEKAEVVGYDKNTDVAVLRIKTKRKLTTIPFGDSSKLKVGDWVLAIGNPLGLGGSVSAGIVSAVSRDINLGLFSEFIQTDAAMNKGNSGGPLVNMSGEVVGINTLIFSGNGFSSGIGFAVPSSVASYVVQKIIESGSVTRAWLGVALQPMDDDIAKYYNQEKPGGAFIAEVVKDGPAEKAGVKPGDLVIELNGKPIENARELYKIVSREKVGNKVSLVVLRGNKKLTLTAKVEKRPDSAIDSNLEGGQGGLDKKNDVENSNSNQTIKGLYVQDIAQLSLDTRRVYKVPDKIGGVFVVKVEHDSAAYKKGLRTGCIIRAVNHVDVNSIADFRAQIELAKKSKKPLLLFVHYPVENIFRIVAVPI